MIKNFHGNTVDFLGQAIVAGRYALGGTIPPEPVLCFELSTSKKGGPAKSLPLHRAVLDAVIGRNAAKAGRAISVLIDGAHEDIEQVLGSRRRLPQVTNRH